MKHIKPVALVLFISACQLLKAEAQAPITRYPAVSSWAYTNILSIATNISGFTYPKYLIMREGQFSDDNSSLQNEPDYFVICDSSLPGGATVLKVGPLPRSGNGIWIAPVVFSNMLSGATYSVDPDPSTLCAPFVMSGLVIRMKISYGQSTDHPRMQLTWGQGSGYGSPGDIVDDFTAAFVDLTKPLDTRVSIRHTNGIAYVGITTTNENVVAQCSTSFTAWSDDPQPPLRIDGYTQWHAFASPTNKMFFRSRTTK